jgi:thymidylate synthase (FAD)
LSSDVGGWFSSKLWDTVETGKRLYDKALEAGVAPEQARLFLPAYGMYVRWRWTVSLHGILNFLEQRLEHDAQSEIRDYALAVKELTKDTFPYTYEVVFNAR